VNTPDMKLVLCVTWFVGSLAFPLHAADLGPRDATMWLCEEWSLENRLVDGLRLRPARVDEGVAA